MTRFWKYSAMVLLALAIFVPAASARPGIIIGGYFGPGWYGPAYGWYGGPAYVGYGYERPPVAGKVKIETKMKDASVYVDGGYAGTVRELGTFPLRVGTHNIEVRDPSGHSIVQEQINILGGKTTKIAA